jgi:hypothetical protein
MQEKEFSFLDKSEHIKYTRWLKKATFFCETYLSYIPIIENMLTIFEGARNSGKTYLANRTSQDYNIPVYKFEYVKWFEFLGLEDESIEAHALATGKECALLQLNRDGHLKDAISDRGPLTILVWSVLSNRISRNKAIHQLREMSDQGLFDNCKIFYIFGDNPNKTDRNKDRWDFRDSSTSEERELYDFFIEQLLKYNPDVNIYKFENKFNETSIIRDL